MTSEPAEVTSEKFRMWLRPDGIVQLVWNPRVHILDADAKDATAAMARLTGSRRAGLLVNAHNTLSMERSAREEFVQRADLVTAVALVVATPLSRLMGNFFIAVNSPTAPTRLFDDEESALAWLETVT
jgi:hypothetical protein